MSLRLLASCTIAAAIWTSAAMAQPPSGGVYAIIDAATPKLVAQQQAAITQALQNAGVDGLLIHLRWNEISMAPMRYDWSALDAAAQLAINAKKRFEIGIVTGGAMPDWIYTPPPDGVGAPYATFEYNAAVANGCNSLTIAAPYSQGYNFAFRDLLHQLAAHLHRTGIYEKLSMLKLVGITTTTNELRLPALNQCAGTTVQSWQKLGYTPAKMRKAWSTMLQEYRQYFPGKSFNIGFIGINAFPGIGPDGSAAKTPQEAAALSAKLVTEFIEDAGATMRGHLALGFDSLTLNQTGPSYGPYIQAFYAAAADGKARLGWQTNELLQQAGGAACGGSKPGNAIPCANSAQFRAMLFAGIYPLGKTKTPPDMHGVYLELFPQNINAWPQAVRAAHENLATW